MPSIEYCKGIVQFKNISFDPGETWMQPGSHKNRCYSVKAYGIIGGSAWESNPPAGVEPVRWF